MNPYREETPYLLISSLLFSITFFLCNLICVPVAF
mgnify:CR=1 FL=1